MEKATWFFPSFDAIDTLVKVAGTIKTLSVRSNSYNKNNNSKSFRTTQNIAARAGQDSKGSTSG